MLILLHHLRLDSLLPRVVSQESKHEVGAEIYSFRAKGELEVKGSRALFQSVCRKSEALLGRFFPTRQRSSWVLEL